MGKIVGCYIIIKDDFNNVLLLKRKVKRGENPIWSFLYQKIRGKESAEKCINKGIKDKLKSVVFDLTEYMSIDFNEEESAQVFTGIIRERVSLDKEYTEARWISQKNYMNFEFDDITSKLIEEYFKNGSN